MTQNHDAFWEWIAPQLRKAFRLEEPSLQEIEEALKTTEGAPIPEAKVEEIVAKTLRKSSRKRKFRVWMQDEPFSTVEEDMLAAVHRNQGDNDPEIEALLEKHRQEALKENEDEAKNDDRNGEGSPVEKGG